VLSLFSLGPVYFFIVFLNSLNQDYGKNLSPVFAIIESKSRDDLSFLLGAG